MAGPQECYYHVTISQRKRRCLLDSIEIAVEESAKGRVLARLAMITECWTPQSSPPRPETFLGWYPVAEETYSDHI